MATALDPQMKQFLDFANAAGPMFLRAETPEQARAKMQALLASQDIQSTPTLVGTQKSGFELPEIPCWQAFNHVFNYLPEFKIYADATSTFNPFGTLPEGDRGKPVIYTASYDGIQNTPTRGTLDNVTLTSSTLKIAPVVTTWSFTASSTATRRVRSSGGA